MKRILPIVALFMLALTTHAEDLYLLDSIVRKDDATGFLDSRSEYTYNAAGQQIKYAHYWNFWTSWKVGKPMILNRLSVVEYNDEGKVIDRYSAQLDTATGIWSEQHPYIFDDNGNVIYVVHSWNEDSTVVLSGYRYYYDDENFETAHEYFNTWNNIRVVTSRAEKTKNENGLVETMVEYARPDEAYSGDYLSDPEAFNLFGWNKTDSVYYEWDNNGNKLRETSYRWYDESSQWIRDGEQVFEYDEYGKLLADTVFSLDWETNEITYNNMTSRMYDSHNMMCKMTTYSPQFTEGEVSWQVNDEHFYEYSYDEDGNVVSLHEYTDYHSLYSPIKYYTSTYYYSIHYQTPTHVQNTNSAQVAPYKFIRNGQLFILRDGKTYTVQGQEVR